MSAFVYGVALQWKLDIRSKSMLITCYLLPLLFFAFMGGIFTSITPEARLTLVQSMTIFGVSMGALVGLPPSLVEIYGSDMKNMYKANGVPLYLGVITNLISAFIHLMIMSLIILLIAPLAFDAAPPENLPVYFLSLAAFVLSTLGIGSVLGLAVKNMSKLTMITQFFFMPSIMLSGIMFPIEMLPKGFGYAGRLFPAAWGYKLMTSRVFEICSFIPLAVICLAAVSISAFLLIRMGKGK